MTTDTFKRGDRIEYPPRTIAPSGRPYRISSESAWPLRGADGRTFAERKASQLQERPA